MTNADDILHRLERADREREASLRKMLIDAGREDILAQYDENMRNLRLGITGARNAWHSLSGKQRWVLQRMAAGRYVQKSVSNPRMFHGYLNGTEPLSGEPGAFLNLCRLSTLRSLSAHELIHVAGGTLDPEAKFIITERGLFVVKYGRVE